VSLPHVKRIAITPGEPAGCGPDICAQLAQLDHAVELVFFADPQLLCARATQLGLGLRAEPLDLSRTPKPHRAGTLPIVAHAMNKPCNAGQPNTANADYVLRCLRAAADACLGNSCAALVTGPIHKATINQAGVAFTGHTEFLARHAGVPRVVMMLTCPGLRVALVTTHLPLREVATQITPDRVDDTLRITHEALRSRFGISNPRLVVLGLNPHAGEGGYLGDEEQTVITPVIERWRSRGMAIEGPLPADTAFTPPVLARCDAVLAMYHDQGLPVLKHAGFGQAVNITLGLPFIRTSVDHGTALELAGTGRAYSDSLAAALATAIEMTTSR